MADKPRILIIDDEAAHLALYSLILESGGFPTTTALVGYKGLDIPSRDQEFDLYGS